MQELAARLSEEGAQILERCKVVDLRSNADGRTVETDTGEVRAEKVVVAAGLLSTRLLSRFGTRLAVQPARGIA